MQACFDDQFHVLNFVDVSEFSKVSSKNSVKDEIASTKGILRVDWIQEHQSRYPSVAVLTISREDAAGGPSAWASLVSTLSMLTAACKPRGIYIVIVVIAGNAGNADLPEDRAMMVCRQAGIERSRLLQCALISTRSDIDGGLGLSFRPEDRTRLKDVVSMEASRHYNADSQRRLANPDSSLPPLSDRLSRGIKLGALAEMRNDWESAERLYLAAYNLIPQAASSESTDDGDLPVQKFLELRALAQLITFRVMGLLIQVMTNPQRAVDHLRHHLATFRSIAAPGSLSQMLANQAGWVSEQLCMAAQLLSHVDPTLLPSSARPARLYLDAAHASMERRRAVQKVLEVSSVSKGKLLPGPYVGRYCIPGIQTIPSDDQVLALLQAEESVVDHRTSIISLLRKSISAGVEQHEGEQVDRVVLMAKRELGSEVMGNINEAGLEEAQELLVDVAQGYRAERWRDLLLPVLFDLKTVVSRKDDTSLDLVSLDLEIAYLQGDVQASLSALTSLSALATENDNSTTVVSSLERCHPWPHMINVVYGISPLDTDSDLRSLSEFVVALRNCLPVDVRLHRVEVGFEDGGTENMTTTATPLNPKSDIEGMVLSPGVWVLCRAKVPAMASGSITASHIDLVWHQSVGKLRYVITKTFDHKTKFNNSFVGFSSDSYFNGGDDLLEAKMRSTLHNRLVEWGHNQVDMPLHQEAKVSLWVHSGPLETLGRSLLMGEQVPLDLELHLSHPHAQGMPSIDNCTISIDASSSTCALTLAAAEDVSNTTNLGLGRMHASVANPAAVLHSDGSSWTVPLGRYLCTPSSPGEVNMSIQVDFELKDVEKRLLTLRTQWTEGGIPVHRPFNVEVDVSGASTDIVTDIPTMGTVVVTEGGEGLLNGGLKGSSDFSLPVASNCPAFINLRTTSQTDTPIIIHNISLVWEANEVDLINAQCVTFEPVVLATLESSCCAAFLITCGSAACQKATQLHPKARIEWSRTEGLQSKSLQRQKINASILLPILEVTAPTWKARPRFDSFASTGVLTQLIIELESIESAVDLDVRIGQSPLVDQPAGGDSGPGPGLGLGGTGTTTGKGVGDSKRIDFLIAGPTATTMSLPPRDTGRVCFGLVPLKVGHLPLPMVTVVRSVGNGGVAPKPVHVTEGCLLFVNHEDTSGDRRDCV